MSLQVASTAAISPTLSPAAVHVMTAPEVEEPMSGACLSPSSTKNPVCSLGSFADSGSVIEQIQDHWAGFRLVRYRQVTLLEKLYNIYTGCIMLIKVIVAADPTNRLKQMYEGAMFYLNMFYIPDGLHYLIRSICLMGGAVVFDIEPIYTEGGKTTALGLGMSVLNQAKLAKQRSMKAKGKALAAVAMAKDMQNSNLKNLRSQAKDLAKSAKSMKDKCEDLAKTIQVIWID